MMTDQQIQQYVQQAIKQAQNDARYSTSNASYHTHNGIDSPLLSSSTSSSLNGRYGGSDVTSIPTGGTTTKIKPNTKDFLNGITWDATNYRFVIKTAGQYLVTGLVTYSSPTDGTQFLTYIYKNGSQVATMEGVFGPTYPQGLQITTILNLVVSDYIELYTAQLSGAPASIYNDTRVTYLAIAKV